MLASNSTEQQLLELIILGPNEGLNSSELTNTDQYYIIIPAGEKSKTVNITGLDDSTVEQEETIEIEIGEVSSCGLIGSSSKRNLRINDDDLIISLSLVSGQDTVLEEEGSLKSLLQVSSNETLTEDVESVNSLSQHRQM